MWSFELNMYSIRIHPTELHNCPLHIDQVTGDRRDDRN